MEPIPFDPHMDVGIDVVDADHRRLLDLVNRLLDHENRREYDQALTLVEELRAAAVDHFAHEETLMRDGGYWGFNRHHDDHVRLLRQFDDYMGRLKANGCTWHAGTLALYMADWLIHHIDAADRRFGEWFAGQAKRRKT